VQLGSYGLEDDEETPIEKLQGLESALLSYLSGFKTATQAAHVFRSTIGTSKPFKKVLAIVQTADSPIPDFSGFIPFVGQTIIHPNLNHCRQMKPRPLFCHSKSAPAIRCRSALQPCISKRTDEFIELKRMESLDCQCAKAVDDLKRSPMSPLNPSNLSRPETFSTLCEIRSF
jgi:hypothetical protein